MASIRDDREPFDAWLSVMDDAIEKFLQQLPRTTRNRLDGTIASLDLLEAWLLERYPTVEAARQPPETALLDGAARYFGEVLRKGSGSGWGIELGDPKALYFGVPTLRGGILPTVPACPLTMVTTALDRRTGHFLRSMAERHAANRVVAS